MTPKSLIAPARLARRPVLATQTDARLVDLVRAGYEPAFEAIVARYRGGLLRYTGRFLAPERAEDVVQQSFVSAYEAMLRDGAELNLRPWLYRIAHNTSLNALRDRGLRHDELDESIDGVERPDQALERIHGLRDVVTAVQALPGRQRDAIVLRELEGRSYDEIASELGVSDGSVRQLLNRARNTLRAGATALTPAGLLLRIPWAEPAEPLAAGVAKAAAAVLVTGAVVGGVAVAPERNSDRAAVGPDRAEARESRPAPPPAAERGGSFAAGAAAAASADVGEDREDHEDREDRSGSGGGGDDDSRRERDDDEGRSGPSDDGVELEEARESDNSGPSESSGPSAGSGSGSSGEDPPEAEVETDSSGSGSSGSGGSGSGSDDSD